jgi:glycogen operon protein
MLGEFAERFTGSPDLYKNDYRLPTASINFVTAHDGFTLNDLVSYNEKHNWENGENNNDGESHNLSWNCGVEGPTEDIVINELREQQKRNFLTTLFLSQGVPMIVAGDEISKTQRGNNNPYCQDNEISWMDWKRADKDLLVFTQKLIQFRHRHPVFCRRRWFKGQPIKGVGLEDIQWFKPDGAQMSEENWKQDYAKSLAIYLNGRGIKSVGTKGEIIIDDSFYIIFNAFHGPLSFSLPGRKYGDTWMKVIDTSEGYISEEGIHFKAEDEIKVEGRSVVVLKQPMHQATKNESRTGKAINRG